MNKDIIWRLTWEDVKEILESSYVADGDVGEGYCTEVLNRIRRRNGCMACVDEYAILLPVAEAVVGCQLSSARNRDNTLIRCLIAYRLRREGYRLAEIGRVMGRSHANIINLIKKLDDMMSLPNMYREEIDKYRRFEELVNIEDE